MIILGEIAILLTRLVSQRVQRMSGKRTTFGRALIKMVDLTSSAVNSTTEDSVQNTIIQTESTRTSGHDSAVQQLQQSRVEPPVVNSVAIASSAAVDNTSDFFRESGLTRETLSPGYNVITETSSYMKRVVEETETVTTG
ncbi:unnamed protein product [Candidula unifasciata]|uniref:Uncharacterized protein n=1 Tax=Candidula unifasciata TaxID=100452 RepID=A0A8S3YN50_9EUPU|nr:unnamed protein product [Candidula unifasciata]